MPAIILVENKKKNWLFEWNFRILSHRSRGSKGLLGFHFTRYGLCENSVCVLRKY